MLNVIKRCLVCLCGFSMAATVQATDYEITIEADSAMNDELDMVSTFMESAVDGTQASRGIRKLVNGLISEIDLIAESRIDDFGNVTLDDGSVVQLVEGDKLLLKPRFNGSYHKPIIRKCYFFTYAGGFRKGRLHELPTTLVFLLRKFVLQIPAGKVLIDDINYPCGGSGPDPEK